MRSVREAESKDLAAITEIYNEAVLTTTATFDIAPRTTAQQEKWFSRHGEHHPILVYVEDSGRVVGWASLSEWSDRQAYSHTAEISLYVKAEFRGKGYGRALLQAAIEAGKKAKLETILARIVDENEVSIRLHESFGFENVGTLRRVGRKFGKLLDVRLMQFIYS